ncbi:Aldo/keto reductase-like protein [Xylaria longipes]|nr:Aldo/keto reductase-like protein [Xylaria longipes]
MSSRDVEEVIDSASPEQHKHNSKLSEQPASVTMSPQKLPLHQLGRDGPQVPQLGFGLMELSISYENTTLSDAERFKVLDRAWEIGATFWDTAAGYGDSEALIGKWLKLHPERRQDVFIATKFGFGAKVGGDGKVSFTIDSSPENCRRSCEKSLLNLGVDSIDLFYVHRFDRITPVEKTMEALVDLKRKGKIKYIGLSEPSSDTLRRACAIHSVSAVQIEYNPWSVDIETEVGTNLQATCRKVGVAIVPYSPLGRGFLSGKFRSLDDLDAMDKRRALPRFSLENFPKNIELANTLRDMAAAKNCMPAQLTLAWIMAQGQDMFPIPGTKNLKYLEQNVGSFDVEMTPEDNKHIREMIKLMGGASGARQVAHINSSDLFYRQFYQEIIRFLDLKAPTIYLH